MGNTDEAITMERAKKGAEQVGKGAACACNTVFCLPKDFNHVSTNETICCNHPLPLSSKAPCTCWFALPLGAVVGFAAGISGWWYFNDGVNAVDGHLNKVGIYIRILGDVLNWLSYMEVMRPCSNDA